MSEKKLHKAICNYIKLQYKNVYFLSDPSGLKMSIGMATELKKTRSNHAQLDIVILEPNKYFKGLILEVKKNKSEVYTKKGELRNNAHLLEQFKTINHLKDKGYFCGFVYDFNEATNVIDDYLKDVKNN